LFLTGVERRLQNIKNAKTAQRYTTNHTLNRFIQRLTGIGKIK
jgi:hypothetical protein